LKVKRLPAALILAALFASPAPAEGGLYSAAQAERGQAVYDRHCVACHAAGMTGGGAGSPPLVGQIFMIGWRGESVGALLDYLRTTMPTGMAGSLTDQEYADVLALMLQANGVPADAGVELGTDPEALMDVAIE
jgi:mono/diheme cytochrome c family protein